MGIAERCEDSLERAGDAAVSGLCFGRAAFLPVRWEFRTRRADTTEPGFRRKAETPAPVPVWAGGQAGTMFSACGPFWPCVTSKLTFWPSWSSR
ncbi:hypothetical protein GCM10023082_51810 [Streptomyces tremellae]|uniref:Uncharacterized protein n=1 Tax=Streptomyces tremellae TaxID=1124239 RepID=A0ABP7FWR0_9ACTN